MIKSRVKRKIKSEENKAIQQTTWRIPGKRTPVFVIGVGVVLLLLGLVFRGVGEHDLISIWEVKNVRVDLLLIIVGTLILILYYPLTCIINSLFNKYSLLDDQKVDETRLMVFGARYGFWVGLIVAMLSGYLYIPNKIAQENSNMLSGFVEEQSRYIIENKRLTPTIADDVNNLTLYSNQIKIYPTPILKETTNLLLETMNLINQKGLIEGHKLAFEKYCIMDSIKISLPSINIVTPREKRLYSDYLVLKGTIANELIFQGRDMLKLNYSRRYFEEALQYYDSCTAAYNGLGNALFIELRNSNSFTENNVRQAYKAIQYYKDAKKYSQKTTIYCSTRCLNNQACINLEVMNKLFNYTNNPAIFSKLDLQSLSKEQKAYIIEFLDNKCGIFNKTYDSLKFARQSSPQISDICVSLSQFYAILAQHMYREGLKYEPITSEKIKSFSDKIFHSNNRITFNNALNESCFYLKTAADMGYPVNEVFPTKDVFRESGYQIFEIVKSDREFKNHYYALLEILCL